MYTNVMDKLPNDMLRAFSMYLDFDELIAFGLVNTTLNLLCKRTPWYHVTSPNLKWNMHGYQFKKSRVEIPVGEVSSATYRALTKCASVEIYYSFIDSAIIQSIAHASKIRFVRCMFDTLTEDDIKLLQNAKAIRLEKCEHFEIKYAPLLSISYFNSRNLRVYHLKYLCNVEELVLDCRHNKITIDGLILLTGVRRLHLVQISYLTGDCFSSIEQHLTKCERIYFYKCYITNGGAKFLINKDKYATYHCTQIDNKTTYPFDYNKRAIGDSNHAPNMDCAKNYVTYNNLNNSYLKSICPAKKMHMRLSSNIKPNGFEYIANLNVLYLDVCDCITDDVLCYFNSVEKLSLHHIKNITNDGISKLTDVKILELGTCINITDDGIAHIGNSKVCELTFCYLNITDRGLQYLSGIKSLRLYGCESITDRGYWFLRNIGSLKLYFQPITDNGLSHLSGIRKLILDSCHKITHKGLIHLPKIKYLTLKNMNKFNDMCLKCLCNVHELQFIECDNITDKCLDVLANQKITLYTNITPTAGRIALLKDRFSNLYIKTDMSIYYSFRKYCYYQRG